jgi:vacuolar-type H+-ATPase subunit E/Vma4
MHQGIGDGFDSYRKERERMRRMGVTGKRTLSGPANALEELEAVEQREERDRQLSIEMQDFFTSATKVAADIVQKVASSAKVQLDSRLSHEMEEFLRESITRVQHLVTAVLEKNTTSTAEQVIEPLMHNLVGSLLDEFRKAGTASADKHLGQDPMAQSLDEVRKTLLAQLPAGMGGESRLLKTESEDFGMGVNHNQPVVGAKPDIEEHLVAETRKPAAKQPNRADQQSDLDRFQKALEKMVKKGQMSRAEANAAIAARKKATR